MTTKPPKLLPRPSNPFDEVHRKVMENLRQMTPEEVFQMAVKIGIYTKDGELTQHYRDPQAHQENDS